MSCTLSGNWSLSILLYIKVLETLEHIGMTKVHDPSRESESPISRPSISEMKQVQVIKRVSALPLGQLLSDISKS
jgi:hypothetical protein